MARASAFFVIKPFMTADPDAAPPAGPADRGGIVEPGARVSGPVYVQAGARTESDARVTGPVLVCSCSVITAGALVRDHSVIGPGCRVGFGAEIPRGLLLAHVFMKHPGFVGDAVIGRRVNLGAFFSTTGLRCDRGPVAEPAIEEITVTLDGQRVSTGQTKFGAVLGDETALPPKPCWRPAP